MKGRQTPRTARKSQRPPTNSRRRRDNDRGSTESVEVEGTLSVNRNGYGFVRAEGMEQSVFLPPGEMGGLMQGDRVRVAARGDGQGRFVGRVLGIVDRGVQSFLATIEPGHRSLTVRAADSRLGLVCRVVDNVVGARSGDWVIATIRQYPSDGKEAEAAVVKKLDPERPVDLATEAAIARAALTVEFSSAALREAQAFGQHIDPDEVNRRADIRHLPLVTIDGADSRDFDDAVYAERVAAGGFRLLVAIADVSHYVTPGSALDAEAAARGTSVYFPTRVVPMLPTSLSNHLCSLEPQVDRLCMVADMHVSTRGELQQASFYPAVMRSAFRLTYDLAHQALFDRSAAARAQLGDLADKLQPLVEVYASLLAAREQRGALDFDAPEAHFVIDGGDQVRAIEFKSRNEAHRLIEECMVLANVAVARELREHKVASLMRVHASPDPKRLEQLAATLRVLGMEWRPSEDVSTRELASVTAAIRDPRLKSFVGTLVVRSLAQALYQPEQIGHFGLALTDYAHFTSPIRRYPDLMIHRALRQRLGLAREDQGLELEQLQVMGTRMSQLERRADESDRYVDNFLKCVWLRDRIGQSFAGIVTTVTEFGCFVQLTDVGIDGLLALASMKNDDYVMHENGGQWIASSGGPRLSPGAEIRVVVVAVRPVEGQVELELAAA